jgi:DNA polymerase III delta subunit
MSAARTTRKPDKTCPAYMIVQNDALLADEALREILCSLLGDDPDPMAITEFDDERIEPVVVLDELRTPSLLSPRRVVIFRDADAFISRERQPLEKYLKSPAADGVLILLCRKNQSNTRIYRTIKDWGGARDCEPPKEKDLPPWIVQRARNFHGCTVSTDAAEHLRDLIGPHLARLNMELAKLATFVSPRTRIEAEDVSALVEHHRQTLVFALRDSLVDGRAADALDCWQRVMATDRSAEYAAVGALASTFRGWIDARRMYDRGEKADRIRGRFWWMRFPTPGMTPSEIERRLRRFSIRQWENFLLKLLKIDIAGKTGVTDSKTAVEKFIVEMCRA